MPIFETLNFVAQLNFGKRHDGMMGGGAAAAKGKRGPNYERAQQRPRERGRVCVCRKELNWKTG